MMLMIDIRNSGFGYNEESYSLKLGENHYNLSKPVKRWDLPSELKEISGIACLDEHTILCIQDENGTVFSYDLIGESISRKIVFGKSGDYEDIALVNGSIYVLKSNGHLYNFALTDNDKTDVIKFSTSLSEKNDTEGLAFDALNNRLLIACKNSPLIDAGDDKGRAVYEFDLTNNKLREKPIIFIPKKTHKEALLEYGLDEKAHSPFQPSGIAIHPATRLVVIICSAGKIMLIIDRDGNIENLIPLDSKLFVQPEGICFGPNGELFISSEGKNGKGYILKF